MQFKRLIGGAGIALALAAVGMLPARQAQAAAITASFQTAITFQNVGAAAANVEFDFYPEGVGTPIKVPGGTLAPGASNSLGVGQVQQLDAGGFSKGSAVLSASQPVIATIVQFANGIANRPLSNGFGDADAAAQTLIATALKARFGTTTVFSVQNVEAEATNINVAFYAVGTAAPVYTLPLANVPAYAARYVNLSSIAQLPNGFNGSAVVTAAKGSGAAAKTVVTINELGTASNAARAFEGVGTGSNTVYMPSALCNFTSGGYTHGYAISNAGSTPVTFDVTYFPVGRPAITTQPFTIPPGGKQSVEGCTKSGIPGMPPNVLGSAIIRRTAGAENALVAIAKFVGKTPGLYIDSAAVGIPEGGGGTKLAAAYVRWSPDSQFNTGKTQRTFLAVQNVSNVVANNVRVQYINKDGVLVKEQALGNVAPGQKVNSDPRAAGALDACGRFGYYGNGCANTTFGGGVYILSDSGALAAVARTTTGGAQQSGEDYNAVKIQ